MSGTKGKKSGVIECPRPECALRVSVKLLGGGGARAHVNISCFVCFPEVLQSMALEYAHDRDVALARAEGRRAAAEAQVKEEPL